MEPAAIVEEVPFGRRFRWPPAFSSLISTVKARPLTKRYELTFEKRADYLYACIQAASVDRAMALDYLGEISHMCAATHSRCLLIDRDIPSVVPKSEAIQAIQDFVNMSRGLKIAFVNRHGSVGSAFKQLVSDSSDQGAEAAYFTTIADAEEWLRHDSSK